MKNAKNLSQKQLDHHADTLNKNKGTSGTNITNAKAQGNRGKQMDPNQDGKTQDPGASASDAKGRGR